MIKKLAMFAAQKLSGQGKTTGKGVIKSVKPNVPGNKSAIVKHKSKMLDSKLKEGIFDLNQKIKKLKKEKRVYSGKELEQQEYFKYKKNKKGDK
jgi:adenylate kinase